MSAKKKATKKRVRKQEQEVSTYLEKVFLAGLGALSDAQRLGTKAFDSLVKEGEKYRRQTSNNTEQFIDDVQGTLRGIAEKAQTRASGLVEQVRDASHLDRLESVFDERVSRALSRLGVPTHAEIKALNTKLDRILKEVKPKTAAKKKVTKRKATKTQARKKTKKKAGTRSKAA